MKSRAPTPAQRREAKPLAARPYAVEIRALVPADGGGFIACNPEFGAAGCTATGDTIEEALHILDAVRLEVIELALRDGQPIPEPEPYGQTEALHQVPFRVPGWMHNLLKAHAERDGVSLNTLLSIMAAEFLTARGSTGQWAKQVAKTAKLARRISRA